MADLKEEIVVSFAHSASTLDLRLTSTLDENAANESWGLSELKVIYCNKTDGDCVEGEYEEKA